MTLSKKPLLEIYPYPDEFEYEDFCLSLAELVEKRFKTGYVKCEAKNMGWQRRSGYKVFKIDEQLREEQLGMKFLNNFMPNCEWCAKVYSLNNGKGLCFIVAHHDNPVSGDEYYLTPISERTYERLS